MGLIVTFDDMDRATAHEAALQRQKRAMKRKRVPNGNAPPNDPKNARALVKAQAMNDIGCCGEMAVSKAGDFHWTGGGLDTQAPDVGPWEVRATHDPERPLTLKKPKDMEKADRAFIHVVALDWGLLDEEAAGRRTRRRFELVGWAWGYEVMVDEFWRPNAPKPCWEMPQNRLRDLRTLELPPRQWRGEWS